MLPIILFSIYLSLLEAQHRYSMCACHTQAVRLTDLSTVTTRYNVTNKMRCRSEMHLRCTSYEKEQKFSIHQLFFLGNRELLLLKARSLSCDENPDDQK